MTAIHLGYWPTMSSTAFLIMVPDVRSGTRAVGPGGVCPVRLVSPTLCPQCLLPKQAYDLFYRPRMYENLRELTSNCGPVM